MEIKTYHFPPHGDDRGQLVAIEELRDLPFAVKRVYYIYDTLAGVRRGFHAHKCLEQILVCVCGSCRIH
jgi:dTDP-4-dehydrorhamnose 3,5-epimerase-like enzyme